VTLPKRLPSPQTINQHRSPTWVTRNHLNLKSTCPTHSPSLVLISKPLEGHNYGQWTQSMRIALSAKNKLGFNDGTIKSLACTDAKFVIWQICNDMVLLWILQSLNPDITSSGMILRTVSHKAMIPGFSKSTKKLPNIDKGTL
jgi:hypothetical protein